MHVWRKVGINFIELLGLQETTLVSMERPEEAVYARAKELSIIYLLTFIVFNVTQRFTDPGVEEERKSFHLAHALPLVMIGYFGYCLVTPWVIRKRWWFFLLKVICAPFYIVDFQASYIGDLLTSLVRVLMSMAYASIYILLIPISLVITFEDEMSGQPLTGFQFLRRSMWWKHNGIVQLVVIPMLTLAPLLIRLFQCLRRSVETGERWPHMANACKYTSAILVIATGTLQPSVRSSLAWVLCFVGATCYQYVWDLTMDWGIVVKADSDLAQTERSFGGLALRKDRLLGSAHMYLLIMAGNLLLRFAWTLTLLQPDYSATPSFATAFMAHLTPFVAAAEVMRRMVWGFLRLEWEHMEKMEVNSNPKEVYSRVEITPRASAGAIVSEGDINPEEMEKMSIGNSSEYPNFNIPWDPDGRLHSILPHLARFSRCCVGVDLQGLFESRPALMPSWWTDYACTSLGRGLYLSITDDEEGGEEAKGGDRDSAFKATQQERFSEGLLFGSCVLCYILLLVAYRVMS